MTKHKEKFRHAFLPLTLITFGTTLLFNAIYYILIVARHADYKSFVTVLVLPACCAAIIQLTVIMPFIKKFKFAKNQSLLKINLLSFMLLCSPLMLSEPLIDKLSAKVIAVDEVSEIDTVSKDYCFTVRDFTIDLERVGEEYWTERKHRRRASDYIELNLILAAPIKNKSGNRYNLRYWFYKDYSYNDKHINGAAEEYNNFMARSRNDFKSAGTVRDIKYLERLSYRHIGDHTLGAINDIMYRSRETTFVVLKPHYKSLGDETVLQAFYIFLAFLVSTLFWAGISWQIKLKKQPAKQNRTSHKA